MLRMRARGAKQTEGVVTLELVEHGPGGVAAAGTARPPAQAHVHRTTGDLGLELGKTLKLEWHKASNQRIRCLRITAKEEKAVRGKLQVRHLLHAACGS
jgi:hypothetical protein